MHQRDRTDESLNRPETRIGLFECCNPMRDGTMRRVAVKIRPWNGGSARPVARRMGGDTARAGILGMSAVRLKDFSWERMIAAVDAVRERTTVAALDALVRMKLTSFRLKDKVHLLDLLDVGLIDENWCDRFPPAIGARLRELIESRDHEV